MDNSNVMQTALYLTNEDHDKALVVKSLEAAIRVLLDAPALNMDDLEDDDMAAVEYAKQVLDCYKGGTKP